MKKQYSKLSPRQMYDLDDGDKPIPSYLKLSELDSLVQYYSDYVGRQVITIKENDNQYLIGGNGEMSRVLDDLLKELSGEPINIQTVMLYDLLPGEWKIKTISERGCNIIFGYSDKYKDEQLDFLRVTDTDTSHYGLLKVSDARDIVKIEYGDYKDDLDQYGEDEISPIDFHERLTDYVQPILGMNYGQDNYFLYGVFDANQQLIAFILCDDMVIEYLEDPNQYSQS